jgi:rhodanese-related sulfurtransferase
MVLKKGYKALLDEALAQIETVPTAQAIAAHGDPDVVVVDLRDPRELQREGIIPGAFHALRDMIEFWVDPESPYHKPIFATFTQFITAW